MKCTRSRREAKNEEDEDGSIVYCDKCIVYCARARIITLIIILCIVLCICIIIILIVCILFLLSIINWLYL
jgi:hypothetical protein